MLTLVVARNLAGPDVTVLAGLFDTVLLIVSIVFWFISMSALLFLMPIGTIWERGV